ncbi:MAG TPA: hypothetical protein VNT30_10420 [Stellaceae bacterium]|nr:hypothetical protein [Stellaceae bacterium]
MQVVFGSGQLFGTRTDIANASPTRFGALQDISIDFSKDLKELYGQNQVAIALAAGKLKISGKAKFAQVNGKLLNDLFFGQTSTAGQTATASAEAGAIPATPFTVTAANATNFVADLGVYYAATGLPLTRLASGTPITGQYTVAAGIYTFAAADTGLGVLLNYAYTVAGTGTTLTLTNQLMGVTPLFSVNFTQTFQGKQVNLKLNACASQKLTFATKIDDFVIPEFDFLAQADAAGNIGLLSLAE